MKKVLIILIILSLITLSACTTSQNKIREINQDAIKFCEEKNQKWVFTGYSLDSEFSTICISTDNQIIHEYMYPKK